MKKYKIYIVAVITLSIGLLIGWLLFNNNPTAPEQSEDKMAESKTEIWTCSMHPQIRQNEPGDCPICGMDLIPASQASSNNEMGFQMTEEAIKLANIQTTIIGGRNQSNSEQHNLSLNGKIEADERQIASLTAHIPGRIEKLYIGFTGEYVKKGQRIARVYSPELITAQRELIEAKKIQDISPQLLNAARNKLRFLKLPEATIDRIQSSEIVQEQFDIYADASGVVKEKRVQVGDHAMEGSVLFEVQNLYNLWVIFEVYESDLPLIKRGDKVTFTTPSAPNKTFTTTINFIDPVIDKTSRIARIRGEISNNSGQLKPEMFIEGQLKQREIKTALKLEEQLIVPKSAVLWTGERSVVYVKLVDTDIPSFEFREIELGKQLGSGYEVKSGIVNGEEVVTNGAFVIDASVQLNNQTSMMNRNVMAKNSLHSEHLPDYTSSTPTSFKEQLSSVTNTYFLVKDALVESNSKEAINGAEKVLGATEKVDMSLVKGKAHIYWMDQQKAIQSHGKKITESTDLEEQRKQFDYLSQALIKSLKVFGVDADTFYVQHCPMANDNIGADWLSKQEKVLNPYYGDKMLKCGIIQDTLDISFKNPVMQEQSNVQVNLHNH